MVGHRDLFGLIRRTDRGLVWLNILHLLPLCLLPFGAALPGWLYVTSRPHLLWQRLDGRQRRSGLALAVFPALFYLLAILVAVVAPGVSLAMYAGLPLLYFLSITVLRSGRERNQPGFPRPTSAPKARRLPTQGQPSGLA